jgi:hypothetical protein
MILDGSSCPRYYWHYFCSYLPQALFLYSKVGEIIIVIITIIIIIIIIIAAKFDCRVVQPELPCIIQAVSRSLMALFSSYTKALQRSRKQRWSASTLNTAAVRTPIISASVSHETKLCSAHKMRVLRDVSSSPASQTSRPESTITPLLKPHTSHTLIRVLSRAWVQRSLNLKLRQHKRF